MSNTRIQIQVEEWIREKWLPEKYNQKFSSEKLELNTGGYFLFDAVSADTTIVVNISTSNSRTYSGKNASAKIQKLRSDMLFLIMVSARIRVIALSEKDMYDLCMKEKNSGRVPNEINFVLVEIPDDLRCQLEISKNAASLEVTPKRKC